MCQEPLQPMPTERWPDLQKVFLGDWPRSLPGYNILETQTLWRRGGLDYGFQVYCPFSDVRNGLIAINEKPSSYDIIIQYPKDDTKSLEEALKYTKNINWNSSKQLKLPFASSHVVECVGNVLATKNLEYRKTEKDFMDTYVIEKDSPLFENVCLPQGHTFELLTSKHVNFIDSYWPHRYSTSYTYFQLLVDSKSGYGLFKDGELTSWILIGECGNLTHLYTLEEHRRKGYGALLLKLITNATIKDRKRDVFGFRVKSNVDARKILPAGFTFELLSSEHIDLIDSKWPHRYHLSKRYFQLLIDAKAGYGLFKNGQLACWILGSECGHLTHLFTIEKYRKQGLAELILKLTSNELLRTNRQVYAFCVKTNENACRLYNKIGFKHTNDVTWGFVDKKS